MNYCLGLQYIMNDYECKVSHMNPPIDSMRCFNREVRPWRITQEALQTQESSVLVVNSESFLLCFTTFCPSQSLQVLER